MIYIDRNSKDTLYMQIYNQLKADIIQGVLKEGDILLGSRVLAQTLHVSRNTVDNAYGQLLAEGYIMPQRGIGYIITHLPKLDLSTQNPHEQSVGLKTSSIDIKSNYKILYDLTNGSHTNDLFPKNLWKRYTLECLEILDTEKKLATLFDKQGTLCLRQTLLPYLKIMVLKYILSQLMKMALLFLSCQAI